MINCSKIFLFDHPTLSVLQIVRACSAKFREFLENKYHLWFLLWLTHISQTVLLFAIVDRCLTWCFQAELLDFCLLESDDCKWVGLLSLEICQRALMGRIELRVLNSSNSFNYQTELEAINVWKHCNTIARTEKAEISRNANCIQSLGNFWKNHGFCGFVGLVPVSTMVQAVTYQM